VNARERLRRYLEQRRELGESELVLDTLPVEAVLGLIGARPGGHRPAAAADSTRVAPDDRRPSPIAEPGAPQAPPAPPTSTLPPAATAWRTAVEGVAEGAEAPPAPAEPLPAWLAALGVPVGYAGGAQAARPGADPRVAALADLASVAEAVRGCTACALARTARNPVPGEGNADAEFVCVGEAPGANEDEQGRPFVGEAGQLLTRILSAIGLSREEVFICNVLKHRPPGNRDPLPEEVRACQPFLVRQLELVRPRVILALGRFAAQTLLETAEPIGRLRGRVHRFRGVPVVVTYHPAALLRNEAWKRPTWHDVQLARRILDASRAAGVAR
jgi:DNA polymerase